MTDYRRLTDRAMGRFGVLAHAIGEDQWTRPTPCIDWDVRALVHHVLSEVAWMPPLLAGSTIAEMGDSLSGDLLGDAPMASWDRAALEAEAAVRGCAADTTVHVSYGDISAEAYVDEVFADLTIHGWDLARGIGADESLDPESVDVLYARFKPREQELKASGAFGAMIEAPPGADRQTELLAVFGRVA